MICMALFTLRLYCYVYNAFLQVLELGLIYGCDMTNFSDLGLDILYLPQLLCRSDPERCLGNEEV